MTPLGSRFVVELPELKDLHAFIKRNRIPNIFLLLFFGLGIAELEY